jgi:hypothetical protein
MGISLLVCDARPYTGIGASLSGCAASGASQEAHASAGVGNCRKSDVKKLGKTLDGGPEVCAYRSATRRAATHPHVNWESIRRR